MVCRPIRWLMHLLNAEFLSCSLPATTTSRMSTKTYLHSTSRTEHRRQAERNPRTSWYSIQPLELSRTMGAIELAQLGWRCSEAEKERTREGGLAPRSLGMSRSGA